jgi:hypothetical protein
MHRKARPGLIAFTPHIPTKRLRHESFTRDPADGSFVIEDIIRHQPPPFALPHSDLPLPYSWSTIQTFQRGQYPYTQDLLALENISVDTGRTRPNLNKIAQIRSPLRAESWREALEEHPDTPLKEYLLRGIQEGF